MSQTNAQHGLLHRGRNRGQQKLTWGRPPAPSALQGLSNGPTNVSLMVAQTEFVRDPNDVGPLCLGRRVLTLMPTCQQRPHTASVCPRSPGARASHTRVVFSDCVSLQGE